MEIAARSAYTRALLFINSGYTDGEEMSSRNALQHGQTARTVRRHAAQNEGQSPKRAGIFGVSRRSLSVNASHQTYPKGRYGGTTHGSLSRIMQFFGGWTSPSGEVQSGRRSPLARKIGIILHRMCIDGTTYRWTEAKPIAAQA